MEVTPPGQEPRLGVSASGRAISDGRVLMGKARLISQNISLYATVVGDGYGICFLEKGGR
jgi:hypothetical protein